MLKLLLAASAAVRNCSAGEAPVASSADRLADAGPTPDTATITVSPARYAFIDRLLIGSAAAVGENTAGAADATIVAPVSPIVTGEACATGATAGAVVVTAEAIAVPCTTTGAEVTQIVRGAMYTGAGGTYTGGATYTGCGATYTGGGTYTGAGVTHTGRDTTTGGGQYARGRYTGPHHPELQDPHPEPHPDPQLPHELPPQELPPQELTPMLSEKLDLDPPPPPCPPE